MEKHKKKQKQTVSGYSKILPAVFAVLALFVIILPLQMPVNSTRAVLSYIFLPQIRAAGAVTDYLSGVSRATEDLLETAQENANLKEEIKALKVANAQTEILIKENQRLADALKIFTLSKWKGTWAKVLYREPSKGTTVMADKGSDDGIELRAPVAAVENNELGLIGKVIEVNPKTCKILLTTDEDFSATAFLSVSGVEGLANGNGKGGINIKYIPLDTPLQEGEKVYTSASSALFPDGLLIGTLMDVESALKNTAATFLKPSVKPAVDPATVKELLIMPAVYERTTIKGGKK